MRLDAHKQAEQLLVSELKRSWNQRLVYLFGDLQVEDAGSQLDLAERWLEQHPRDPVLLLTLGKISSRNQLWGKARSYLESSIEQHATAEAYRLLGALLERVGEADEASACYRRGLELTGKGFSEAVLPAPNTKMLHAESDTGGSTLNPPV
jgi:HemY protein